MGTAKGKQRLVWEEPLLPTEADSRFAPGNHSKSCTRGISLCAFNVHRSWLSEVPHPPYPEWHSRLSGNYSNGRCGKNIRDGSQVFLAVCNAAQQQGASTRGMGSVSIGCQERPHRINIGNVCFDVIQCEFDGSYFFGGVRLASACVRGTRLA